MNIAVLSTTEGHDYSFFAPIVSLIWKHRIEFTPFVFLVGTKQEWEAHQYAHVPLKALEEHKIDHTFVPHIEGVLDKTIAQCVRQHAACLDFDKEDILFPSDIDLIPVRKDFYHAHNPKNWDVTVYYSNAYLDEPWHYPSCHTPMTAHVWREVMKLEGKNITQALTATFNEYGLAEKMKAHQADPDARFFWPVWFTDEITTSKNINASRFYPDRVAKLVRDGHPPKDRLDRSSWPYYINPDKYTDCHSLRPGWSAPNWPRLAPFLKKLIPQYSSWLDEYRESFRKAIGVDQ